MPDIHWGYGFSIGGVAPPTRREGGVISPGGVGYDINCGVRLVRTDLTRSDVAAALDAAGRRAVRARCPLGWAGAAPYRFEARGAATR